MVVAVVPQFQLLVVRINTLADSMGREKIERRAGYRLKFAGRAIANPGCSPRWRCCEAPKPNGRQRSTDGSGRLLGSLSSAVARSSLTKATPAAIAATKRTITKPGQRRPAIP